MARLADGNAPFSTLATCFRVPVAKGISASTLQVTKFLSLTIDSWDFMFIVDHYMFLKRDSWKNIDFFYVLGDKCRLDLYGNDDHANTSTSWPLD
jgi:hypothetical protein